jgi:hypothetical protein
MEWLLLLVVLLALGLWRRWWWLTVLAAHAALLLLGWLLFETTGVVLALIAYILFWGSLAMLALFLLPLRQGRSEWRLATQAIWGFAIGRTRPYYKTKGNELVEYKKGDFMSTFLTGPGIILLPGNHAVALSEGTNYTRVEGPGLVFTRPLERPLQLVDLRPQIRPSDVEATTRDGIRVKTRAFVTFRLKGSGKPGGKNGEYPYTVSAPDDVFKAIRSAEIDPNRKEPVVAVDEVIPNKAVTVARDELATFLLDRLWGLDAQGKDPQLRLRDGYAGKLKKFVEQYGMEFVGGGLNPIEAPDEIIKQRIRSWQAVWQERVARTRGEGEADMIREMGKARAQAQRDLILGILAGLDEANVPSGVNDANHVNDVIAYQFITALERAVQNSPLVSPETQRTLESLRRQVEPAR